MYNSLQRRQTAFGENRRETIPAGLYHGAHKSGNVPIASRRRS
jgi:hypothetical protein